MVGLHITSVGSGCILQGGVDTPRGFERDGKEGDLCRWSMEEGEGLRDWQFESDLEVSDGDGSHLLKKMGLFGHFNDVANIGNASKYARCSL